MGRLLLADGGSRLGFCSGTSRCGIVAIDFEAEGLLDGLEDERARQARLELLQSLAEAGFSLEELRQATAEGRLAMLPVERVLAEEPRYTQRDLSSSRASSSTSSRRLATPSARRRSTRTSGY